MIVGTVNTTPQVVNGNVTIGRPELVDLTKENIIQALGYTPADQKLLNFGPENAGKLVYIGPDGYLTVLAIGEGLEIKNGVLYVTAGIGSRATILGTSKLGETILTEV